MLRGLKILLATGMYVPRHRMGSIVGNSYRFESSVFAFVLFFACGASLVVVKAKSSPVLRSYSLKIICRKKHRTASGKGSLPAKVALGDMM